MSDETSTCHICKSRNIAPLDCENLSFGVTSDSRTWFYSSDFRICDDCGCIQKKLDNCWEQQVEKIYESYDLYGQSGNIDQNIFVDGCSQTRTSILSQRLRQDFNLPLNGSLLDVGYGKGAFIQAFGKCLKDWDLYGYEPQQNTEAIVSSLPGVKNLFHGSLENIEQKFDVISLIHVLEHIKDPACLLKELSLLLSDNGLIFIQVPNISKNPFDLAVVDHASHFSPESLKNLINISGLEAIPCDHSWLHKEISLVVKAGSQKNTNQPAANKSLHLSADKTILWLKNVHNNLISLKNEKNLGIFGTAIAATWISNILTNEVSYFVDEDSQRIGKTFNNKPILAPDDIPQKSKIIMAFEHNVGRQIASRVNSNNIWEAILLPKI